MARVLVVESDAAMRRLVTLHLESETHDVITAEDGAEGLHLALESVPDLIVSDFAMPLVDGIGMLTGIRADVRTAAIPFIFLTDSQDDDLRIRSKSLRVSDYLVKPFDRDHLLRAVSRHMRPRKVRRAQPHNEVDQGPVDHMATVAMAPQYDVAEPYPETPAAEDNERVVDGTVSFFAIRDFARIAETLGDDLQLELMNAFHENVRDVVARNSGWIVKTIEGGFIAMFDDNGGRVVHAERAIKSAILCVLGLSRFGPWVAERFRRSDLPALAAIVGVHSGQVSVCSLSGGRTGGKSERTIIGDVVNVASRLQARAGELGWSIVCSDAVLRRLGPRIEVGRRGQISVKGRANRLDIAEITALQPRPGRGNDKDGFYAGVADAISANTRLIEAQNSIQTTDLNVPEPQAAPEPPAPQAPIEVDGYRILRKVGEGGVAQVYLADHPSSGSQRVLKLVPLDGGEDGGMVKRFVQEYSLLMQITHPNVARVYQHGHEGTHAYMAMEYFPGGDLRGMMRRGCAPDTAVAALVQVAGGLAAVHKTGVVHRDLKPDNIMIRADGSLAIADFGIAKRVGDVHGPTRHGDVMGTPYYLSPEQALGLQADHRADIYSLGVMFYEMLTGKRAYTADTAMGLLHQHAHSPVPMLEGVLLRYQPLIDRMMCKRVEGRFADADGIIEFARACGFA